MRLCKRRLRANGRTLDSFNGSEKVGGVEIMTSTDENSAGADNDESLAARYEITYDGRRYAFRQHHYDVFKDALRFAVAEHGKAGFQRDPAFRPDWRAAYHPDDEDENLMKLHGISYVEGHYRYGGFRYSQLSDAIAFAASHPNL